LSVIPFLLSISRRLPPDFPCEEEKTRVTRYIDNMSGESFTVGIQTGMTVTVPYERERSTTRFTESIFI
jgi:hypothetical protein